jgi:hypothetical protein
MLGSVKVILRREWEKRENNGGDESNQSTIFNILHI